ncbi:hypothetical protein [Bacteroides sp. 519]|uniref:hypothetical protein n=1 Tax=Bacteroides sp. 519 TaxID=2302937 RepID=UPI0013D39227|nr:hypothetical protein [Bacteroides sp. 519]NDV56727.1 hypothetical protein [Bacteroides sp. 519]
MSKEYLSFIDNTEQLLEIYKIVVSQKFSFENQKNIHKIFAECKDKTKNNTSIIEIIETTKMVSGLKKSLSEIINIYNNNQNLFEKINTYSICYQETLLEKEECSKYHEEVETLKIKQRKNSNYADSAWYGRNEKEYERYMQIDKELESEIKRMSIEEKMFDKIYNDKREYVMQYRKNIFSDITELINFYLNVLDNYLPIEKENVPISEPESEELEKTISEETQTIEPDTIFRTKMYEKLQTLEQRLIKDNYLNENLHWISVHKNKRPDIQRLVIFLIGLVENNYFLPNKDTEIKTFFEFRYHTEIGQNFERKRREPLVNKHKVVFYDYPF